MAPDGYRRAPITRKPAEGFTFPLRLSNDVRRRSLTGERNRLLAHNLTYGVWNEEFFLRKWLRGEGIEVGWRVGMRVPSLTAGVRRTKRRVKRGGDAEASPHTRPVRA